MANVSHIGSEQRKSTMYARKAVLYREMAAAITMGDTPRIESFPKSVPRGHTADWYLQRAAQAEQVAETAGDMASLLVDLEPAELARCPHARRGVASPGGGTRTLWGGVA